MAITAVTVNGESVTQFGADDDSYEDLITFAGANTSRFNADSNLPQVIRAGEILYCPENVGVELERAFIIIDPGAAIGIEQENNALAELDNTDRTGIRIVDGTIILNSDVANRPSGAHAQRPSIVESETSNWSSPGKTSMAPLQLKNSTLIFTTSENGNNNGLVVSYSVGDGLGGCRIIWDPSLTSSGDRIFIGGACTFINTDIIDWIKVVFNDLPRHIGIQNFDNVRIIGAQSQIDVQGLTILKGTRFIENTRTLNLLIHYFGGSRTPRRACACFINMTPIIDGGISSTNSTFPFIQKESHSNVNGVPRFFLNEYDIAVRDTTGVGIEGVSIIGFLQKGTGDLTRETALDFSERYKAYAYNTARYDDPTDAEFGSAGENIRTRINDNFSLEGQNELITNSDGLTIVSGETTITNPQFRVVEIKYNGTSSGFARTNFSGHKFRFAKYGSITQDIDVTVGFDTDEDAANQAINVILLADDKITESTKATVAAYTTIANLNQLYDFIRHLEYENRDDPNLELISFDGDTITFPDGATLDFDTTITGAMTVDYSGDNPAYKINASTAIALPSDGNLKGVNMGDNGSIGDAQFAADVSVRDSSGISIVLESNVAEAKIYYQIDPDDGSANTEGYVTSDSNGNYKINGVPVASHVYIVAKKDGYSYFKTDLDPATTTSIMLILSRNPAVDLSVSLSSYDFDPDATSNDNNIYFNFVSGGKSQIVFGEIDLEAITNARKVSNRVFDHIFSLEAAMEFLVNWNRSGGISAIDGKPYELLTDQIQINSNRLDFVRMSGMTTAEDTFFGQYVIDEDDTIYRPPFSNNGRVRLGSKSNIVETPSAILTEVVDHVDENSTKIGEIHTTTEKFEFNNDNDVKATLDGESVDADVDTSGITVDTTGLASQTSVDAIKVKTDALVISSGKVRADIADDEVNIGKVKGTAVAGIADFKLTTSAIAEAVENSLLSETDGRQLLEAIKTKVEEAIDEDNVTTSAIATAVWNKATADLTTSDSIGKLLADDIPFIKKIQSADIEINDSQIVFKYEGSTLLTFNKRSQTTSADYSGGRTKVN